MLAMGNFSNAVNLEREVSHIVLEDRNKMSRRTTKMLLKAMDANSGYVVVIGANIAHCAAMARMISQLAGERSAPAKIDGDRVCLVGKTILLIADEYYDMIRGMSHNTPIFTDHYVYHCRALKRAANYQLN